MPFGGSTPVEFILVGIEADRVLVRDGTGNYFKLPRLTTAQRDALTSPTEGMQIYNADTDQIEVYQNGNWAPIGPITVIDGGEF